MSTEGVIKYQLHFIRAEPPSGWGYPHLESWRRILFRLQMIGRDPHRYGGLGYGNASQRTTAGFVISATQTGELECLQPEHYCLIEKADLEANKVAARGVYPPSSEALTHAAVYQGSPLAQAVFHGHCPEIWRRGRELKLDRTPEGVAYGTPAMATAVMDLVKIHPESGIILMAGHPDGVVAYGGSPLQAGRMLVETLAQVWTLEVQPR